MSVKTKAVFLFITIFIVGLVVGIALEKKVLDKKDHRHKNRNPNSYLFEKFTSELSLTTTQQDTLKMLLDEIKEKKRILDEKRRQELDKSRLEFESDFRKILNAEQAQRYDEMRREFEEKMRKRREQRENQRHEQKKGED